MPCVFHANRPGPFSTLDSNCQFVDLNWPFITVDGQEWCHFHCPMLNKHEQPTKKAGWSQGEEQNFLDEIHRRREVALDAQAQANKDTFRSPSDSKALLDLTGVVFPVIQEFSQISFPAVSFAEATFTELVSFTKTTFLGEAWFAETMFKKDAWFVESAFAELAWLWKATFAKSGLFGWARFEKAAWFAEATFKEQAWFAGATFKEEAWFAGARFGGDVDFAASGHSEKGEEAQAQSFPISDFSDAVFASRVTFENRHFLTTVSFAECLFAEAPIFHGCRLAQGTTFPPRVNFKDVTSAEAVQRYQTLKFAMEQVRGRREESMFYALEQQARRQRPDTPRSEKLIAGLYEWTADYGESFLRPLVWLLLVTELFAFLYASTMTAFFPQGQIGYDVASLYFAIEQVVRPWSGWIPSGGTAMATMFPTDKGLPFSLKILSTIQSLANVGFLGLFIFAVRRKFKLG